MTRTLETNVQRLGYENPSPIQIAAIPIALKGQDLLACAQTGTGKTAAFLLPTLQRILAEQAPDHDDAQVLVLAPTRELATQIDESFRKYARGTELLSALLIGGVPMTRQLRALDDCPEVLIATPGRLLDLFNQGELELDRIETLILDEADRMLDMGFIHDVKKIVRETPAARQTLMFSATMPQAIASLAQNILREPARVTVDPVSSTVEEIDQSVVFVDRQDKKDMLLEMLDAYDAERALVFTRTKRGADRVAKQLLRAGVTAAAIHGNKSQNNRTKTLDRLRAGTLEVVVATDVAARGIDIKELSLVINYDLPNEAEVYVHRIGRTGRAGARGSAVSLCSGDEREYLREIERLTKQTIRVRAA